MNKSIGYILVSVLCLLSCQDESEVSPFVLLDATQTGIDFKNTLVESDSFNIIQYLYFYNGAGVGTGDFNQDGYPDIIFSANQDSPALYLNKADGTLSFHDVTTASGLDNIKGWGTGVSVVDINGDDRLDIYLCQVGNYKSFTGKNRLLINQGLNENGVPQFKDQAEDYGLAYVGLSTQAAFFDYDVDGDLDMYLLNHSVHRTSNYGNANLRDEFNDQYGDRLYENRQGHFVNVTKQANIYGSRIGYGLGIAISDIDNNNYPDMYICNDFHEQDYLYLNQGDGTFKEVIKQSTGHTSQFSMGVDISDINEDNLPDILSLDMRPNDPNIKLATVSHDPNTIFNFKKSLGYHDQYPHNQLQIQQGLDEHGVPRFSELAALINMDATDWSWSALIEDFDQDGHKDVFISNGIARRPNDLDYLNYIADQQVQDKATDLELALKMPTGFANNYFYFQQDNFQFTKVQLKGDFGVTNGVSYADFDLDGDLDLVTNNINLNSFFYENTSNNHYLSVKLDGTPLNRHAIGAKLIASTNGNRIYRDLNPVRGFMSSVSQVVSFGLGDNTLVDSLLITWPDGQRQVLEQLEADQIISISKTDGAAYPEPRPTSNTLLQVVHNPNLQFQHIENDDNEHHSVDYYLQTHNREGPCLAVGDVNADGKPDIFLGNASGSTSSLFLSSESQAYMNMDTTLWQTDAHYEDVSAAFADLDGDGDIDIIVGSHDVGLLESSIRYYINDGSHKFTKRMEAYQIDNPSTIKATDFDNDGDMDYFVGSRKQGQSSKATKHSSPSAIMVNNGQGHFTTFNEELTHLGRVTDAIWADMDQDGDSDLVIAAEWKPLTILVNKESGFSKRELNQADGLWRSLAITDLNHDGHLDIVAGNVGLNSFVKASDKQPVLLNNLSATNTQGFNPIIQYGKGKHVSSIEEIIKQKPQFKKRLTSHPAFANWLLSDSFEAEVQLVGQVTELQSVIFYQDGALNFTKQSLPMEAQYSTVNDIVSTDLNSDGRHDLILGGNEMGFTSSFGNRDASYGLVLLQQSNNTFKALTTRDSGILIDGVIRSIQAIGNDQFMFAINNKPTKIYSTKSQ